MISLAVVGALLGIIIKVSRLTVNEKGLLREATPGLAVALLLVILAIGTRPYRHR
jgi:hypothetical protein